jgi:hypothetical protein
VVERRTQLLRRASKPGQDFLLAPGSSSRRMRHSSSAVLTSSLLLLVGTHGPSWHLALLLAINKFQVPTASRKFFGQLQLESPELQSPGAAYLFVFKTKSAGWETASGTAMSRSCVLCIAFAWAGGGSGGRWGRPEVASSPSSGRPVWAAGDRRPRAEENSKTTPS